MYIHLIFLSLFVMNSAVSAEAKLEQITITATRTDTPSDDLPLTWTLVDQEQLDRTNSTHITEIIQKVPGAWISRGNGQESLVSLRSPVLTGSGACGAYLATWDGIPLRATGFCNVNQLFDLNYEQASKIEVIKGPAPSSFGSDSMHGVINILSAPPSLELDHKISFEYGAYGFKRAKYHYRNKSKSSGISLNANASSDEGYQTDSGYDQQKFSLRWENFGQNWSTRFATELSNLNQETAGYIRGFESYRNDNLRRINPNPEAYRDSWSARAYARLDRKLSNKSNLIFIPYVRSTNMEFLQHYLPWQPKEKNQHRSIGFRSSIKNRTQKYQWIAGIDWEKTKGSLIEFQEFPFSQNQPQGKHYDYTVNSNTQAVFGHSTFNLTNSLALDLGARFESTKYDYDNRLSDGSACSIEASNCRFSRPTDQVDRFSDLSLNLAATFRLNSKQAFYFRTARGFRAPQTTELYRLQSGQLNAFIDSENITSIELGWRGRNLGGFSFDTVLFKMNKEDVVFQDTNRFNIFGAKTSHYGLEASVRASFDNGFYFSSAITAARHRYDGSIELFGAKKDIDGNDIDTSPRFFGSLQIGWNSSTDKGLALFEGEVITLDKYYLDPDNLHKYQGHTLVNINNKWAVGPNLSLWLRVKNLLDKSYAERADFGFGQYRYFVGRDRSAHIELIYDL